MHTVTIYTTPTCPYCKMAKAFFTEHHVSYTEKNIASDATLADEMVQKSGQMGVPVIDVDGTIVVGFDRTKLAQILAIR